MLASNNRYKIFCYRCTNRVGFFEDVPKDFLMAKQNKLVPALGPEFCQIFKRKAGAHPHKNVKRKKTRQKFLRLQTIMREY